MKRFACVSGWMLLVVAGALILLGALSWPPGGLMFALPFIFFLPGAVFLILGGLLVWYGSRKPEEKQ